MKERLTRNIGLKILSFLLAILLWIVILNVDDPAIIKTFKDIPVTRINENAIESEDKVYDVISGNTVDIKVKGKRSVIESLRISNFRAIADLSKLSIVNAVPISVTIPGYDNDVEVDQEVLTMKISLEDLETKQFRINIVDKGTVGEGFYIKEMTASPNMILVSGAKSVIGKINQVVVEVGVTNAVTDLDEIAIPKVYDNNGTLMDSSKMTFNFEEFKVHVDLFHTKKVNLFVELAGEPFYGYEVVDVKHEPEQVEIAGEQSELDKVPYIKAVYDISNKRSEFEDTINIQDYILEDVIVIDDNKNAVIKIIIEKLKTKDISFNPDDIEIRNLPHNTLAIINSTSPINVKVTGTKDILQAISKDYLKPYIDLSDAEEGTKLMNVQFDIANSDIITSYPNVSVTLSQIAEY